MEKIVTIKSNKTGHETTVTEKAWKNGAKYYTGYSLVINDRAISEPKIVSAPLKQTPDIVDEPVTTDNNIIENEELFEETWQKPKRKRKKKDEI